MKNLVKYFIIPLFAITIIAGITTNDASSNKAGCEYFIYISNNSLFEINLTIDGFPSGNLLVGKSKTYTLNLAGDTPKRIKVKAEYQDPDYIDPKSINYITKQKMECGMSDSMFISFTK